MSLQTLITAHESATFDNAPSGFVLSTAAEGAGRIYEFVGEQPLTGTGTAGTIVNANNRGGVTLSPSSSAVAGLATPQANLDTAKVWAVEVKVAKADVSAGQYFFGVSAANATVSSSSPLSANVVVANSAGFYINSGDLDAVVPTSKAGSGNQVDKASVGISAGEYVRLGIKNDPNDRGLRFFVDGNEVAQESTAVPANGTLLRVIIGGLANGGDVDCDYVAVAIKR